MGNYEWRFDIALDWLPFLLSGIPVTIAITAATMAGGLIIGLLVAIIRVSGKSPITNITIAYTEFFRNTPFYTQLIWIYFALPRLLGFSPSPILTALIALSLFVGAFAAEIIRAGITSIELGQWEAAMALGMEQRQIYKRIIIPQAITRVLPPLATMWVSLFKETAVVSLIGIWDLMFRARFGAYRTYRTMEMFTMVALIYLILTWPQGRFADWLYEKLRVK